MAAQGRSPFFRMLLRTDLDQNYQYGLYEKGQDLRFSSLLKVLKALDISLEEFFKEGFDTLPQVKPQK